MRHRNYNSKETEVQIVLFRNEISYDADFQSNRVARIRMTEEELKKAQLISTESSASDSKDDYIDRCIHQAITRIKQKLAFAVPRYMVTPMACDHSPEPSLAPHSHRPISDNTQEATNAIPSGDAAFSILFLFEEGWCGNPQNLCDFAHSYIVNSVLADWFTITLPDLASIYEAKASADLKSLVHEGRSVILSGSCGFFR